MRALLGLALRIRMRVTVNTLAGHPAIGHAARRRAVLVCFGSGIAAGLVLALGVELAGGAPELRHRLLTVLGIAVPTLALLLPIAGIRTEPTPPRAFLAAGVTRRRAVLAAVVAELAAPWSIGLAVLLLAALVGVVGARGDTSAELLGLLGVGAATLALVRFATALGARLETVRLGGLVRALALLLAVATVIGLVPSALRGWLDRGSALGAAVSSVPVLGGWSAGLGGGQLPGAVLDLIVGVLLLALVWPMELIRLRRHARRARRDPAAEIGLLGRVGFTPTAAVAVRSLHSWLSDPRYWATLMVIPIVPGLMLLSSLIGGVPMKFVALVPVPVVVLIVAWATLHNDVAYDSTALWTHIVADVRGRADRIGRAVPALVFGAVVTLLGVPAAILVNGDVGDAPALTGVCVAALLGGVGVSSGVSSRLAYAAPPPGSGAFEAPQSAGSSGVAEQLISLLLAHLVAAPAVAAMVIGLLTADEPGRMLIDSGWTWLALVLGVAAGALALNLGVRSGANAFDRRGPELLALAMRN